MNQPIKTSIRRIAAWLLSLVMLLSCVSVPAFAQEDWTELYLALNWTDASGNPVTVQAFPVQWDTNQSFWATVPGDAPLDGLSLSVFHPYHGYTFSPAEGENLVDVFAASDLSSSPVVISAYDESGALADTYLLYVSYGVVPDEPAPPVYQADATVVWRTEDGTELNRETRTVTSMESVTVYADSFVGYDFVGDRSSVTLTVDGSGNLSESYVEFVYRASEKTATAIVVWTGENGAVFESREVTVSSLNPVVVEAYAVDGYDFVGDRSSVTLTVDENGVISESYVEFLYRTKESFATATVVWKSTDGTVFESREVTVSSTNPVMVEAYAVDGYDFVGDRNTVMLMVDGQGNISENYVEFVYQPSEKTATVHVVWKTEETLLGEQYAIVSSAQPQTFYAQGIDGYTFVGDADAVTVSVDGDGVPSVEEVVFLYAPNQVRVELLLLYGTEDGQILYQETVNLTNNDVFEAVPLVFDGYTLVSPLEPVFVTVDAFGVPSQTMVEFVYAPVPATEPPATEVPVTEAPATEVPVTEAPATEVPVTEVPATEVPVTEAPATEVPVTEAPATEVPAVETPIPQGALVNRWAVTVKSGKTNVRAEKDQNSALVTSLNKQGSYVWVVREETSSGKNTWYSVVVNGLTGYIRSDLLSVLSQAESDAYQATLPTPAPVVVPTEVPTVAPTVEPTAEPTEVPTVVPTEVPTAEPTAEPTEAPTAEPTAEPTEVPTAEPTAEPTEAPTAEPTAEPTEAPTVAPTAEPTVAPTDVPAQYIGYALTKERVALRDGISTQDSSILTTIDATTLVVVQGQVYDNGIAWSQINTLDGVTGMVQDSKLRRINNEEAKYYLDKWNEEHPIETETPAPTPAVTPVQVSGYAYTIGDHVPFRLMANDQSVIMNLLDVKTAVYVAGQVYETVDGWPWHSVMYAGQWGYIRSDMLRMMTPAEAQEYIDSFNTPEPTPEVTQAPYSDDTLSSYGYIFSNNGGSVRVRQNPSTGANTVGNLKPYAMCLILGTQKVNGTTWYHIQYNGLEGFVHGDYLKHMTLKELGSFVGSELYQQGVANNTAPQATPVPTKSIEDQNASQWNGSGSAANPSYATWAPIPTTAPLQTMEALQTPAPGGDTVMTGTLTQRTELKKTASVASDTIKMLEAGEKLTIVKREDRNEGAWYEVKAGTLSGYVEAKFVDMSAAPATTVDPTPTPTFEPIATETVQDNGDGSMWPWIIGVIVLLLGVGGAYGYKLHLDNKRRASQRAAQRRAQAAGMQQKPVSQQGAPRTGTYPSQQGAPRAPQQGKAAQANGYPQQGRPMQQPTQTGMNGQTSRPTAPQGYAPQSRPAPQPQQTPVNEPRAEAPAQQGNPYARPVPPTANSTASTAGQEEIPTAGETGHVIRHRRVQRLEEEMKKENQNPKE